MVMNSGTVVPQNLLDKIVSDHMEPRCIRHLQMPIFFQRADGRLGIYLDAALAGCDSLLNGEGPASLGPQLHGEETASILIRVGKLFSAVESFY